MKSRILLVDNNDSFTFNLYQIISEYENCICSVAKSSNLNIEQVNNYDKIIFSPGPGIPSDFPAMDKILEKYYRTKSILGVCLGHQAIAKHFGAGLINLTSVYHGVKSEIIITEKGEYLFNEIPSNFFGGLYHSWAVSKQNIPSELKITALSSEGFVMALSHTKFDIKGIQFHPESYMTEYGKELIFNWLRH
jgi:glutamine amidotransferase of anthranilate synthase or aminodeoxychorismate synthase